MDTLNALRTASVVHPRLKCTPLDLVSLDSFVTPGWYWHPGELAASLASFIHSFKHSFVQQIFVVLLLNS